MSCEECVRCEADDCEANAYCLSQPTAIYPCAHGRVLCEDHNLTDCAGCREDAEREMYDSGIYSAAADPFIDHTVPPPIDRIADEGGYHWDGRFVPIPRKDTA